MAIMSGTSFFLGILGIFKESEIHHFPIKPYGGSPKGCHELLIGFSSSVLKRHRWIF